MKEIYLAGGCFWGAEQYLAGIHGVLETQVGYANGPGSAPGYEQVCAGSGHAETVLVRYNEAVLPLPFLLALFYDAIDPTSQNRQGNDVGVQYRTGIYYTNPADLPVITASLAQLAQKHTAPLAIEVMPLDNYWPAEEYHQKYLEKKPGGYCHISRECMARAAEARVDPTAWHRPDDDTLRSTLSPEQYHVTRQAGTEPPFKNAFWDEHRKGLYVDITTGEPLFASAAKFDAGCGWPSFAKPIDPAVVTTRPDASHGMQRTEVRSRVGNAHLGHLFSDGPPALGGRRYCINSAALRFIPAEEMEGAGYGAYLDLVE